MPDKKCPMCDGTCILKVLQSKSEEAIEVDVCSMCGATFPKGKGAEKDDNAKK